MFVRRAVPADGPAFLGLLRALAEFERLPPPDEHACARLLEDAFADPSRYELWVAGLQPEEVAAYAATFTTYSTFRARPTLYLEDIFVHPDARRRGLATEMMNHFKQLAADRGCGRFEWLVLAWNQDAKQLYRGLGAEVHPDWQLMRIDLD